jgi:hypothetical protein
MAYRPPRILALRHELHDERIKRVLVNLDVPPVASVKGVQSLMLDWWRRSAGYPKGRMFASHRAIR